MKRKRILVFLLAVLWAFNTVTPLGLVAAAEEPGESDASIVNEPGQEGQIEEANIALLAEGFEPKPPASEDGYYLYTGDLQQAPEQNWIGGNAATGTVSGTWTGVKSEFISYESDMDGLLLNKYNENHLTEPLTAPGAYVWEMDLAIDTARNTEFSNTFSIDLYSSDKSFQRIFSIQGAEALSLNGVQQQLVPENKQWYVLRAVLSLPDGTVSAYLLDRETGEILCQSENAASGLIDFSYIRWSSNKQNSLAYLQDIKFYKNDAAAGENPGGEDPSFEPQPPVRENGYYLNTGDLQQAPEQDWSGGNASTGTVSGTWLSVASDFISYESDMDGLLLKKYYENHLSEPLTAPGDYVWEMDIAIDTARNAEFSNTFSIDLYSSDKSFQRVFSIERAEIFSLNGRRQQLVPENKKWYVLRAVLSLPDGTVSAYLLDRETGEILCQSENAASGLTDFSYIRWSSNKQNSLAYLQDIKFYKNGADTGEDPDIPFHHISGAESIYISPDGPQDVVYQVYTAINEPMPNQEDVTWSLAEDYPGVTLSGSTVTVSPEAQEGVIRLYAAYQEDELFLDITLTKSLYGEDLIQGKVFQYYVGDMGEGFSQREGEELATDHNSETYYTTGTLQSDPSNKGSQIFPTIDLGSGTRYNIVKLKYDLTRSENAPSGLRLFGSPVASASSQYADLVSSSVIDFRKLDSFDQYIKLPLQTKQYIGFHLNTGTSATEKWIPELKIYDFEVYYDGSLLNGIELPSMVSVDRKQEKRVAVTAYNADGDVMTDLSDYAFSGSAQIGCDNVYLDEATGEVVIPTNASLGSYAVTLTHRENPELSFTTEINVNVSESEMPEYFHSISGNEHIVIPKQGESESSYRVLDQAGEDTPYADMVTWKLKESYPGVSLEGATVTVTNEAAPSTITLLAQVETYTISYDIRLVETSASVNSMISEIVGDKFVVSPYYGEQDFSTAQYQAKTYDMADITEGVKWSVKGAPEGVTIDENTGVLSVPPNVNDSKIRIIATKDGLSAEKLVTLVSRYDGGPNLLRLPGVSISNYADENKELSYDGNFSTKSTTEISGGTKQANITLPENYYIDTLRVYKDFGGWENSYQTTARVNGEAFGGKGWSNSPLEADIWQASPAFDRNVIQYSFRPTLHATDIYEMELYSSYIRFDKVVSDKDRVDIPASGTAAVQFTALGENGEPVRDITYADGETHYVKWGLVTPVDGVTIDERTGLMTVSAGVRPTTVTVRAIYFGRVRDKAVSIGSSSDPATLAQMDYDWLTFDKLTSESADNITYKMKLYNAAPNGSSISWTSSRPGYLTTAGDVYLPYTEGDAQINLTATITNGSAVLTKEFPVVIRTPEDFVDKNILSDRELFGLWDPEYNMWAIVGKLDYGADPEFAPIEEAVKAYDYEQAKQLLYDITVDRLKNTDNPPNLSNSYNTPTSELYMNSTSLYTTKAANFITVGNERTWYTADVLSLIRDAQEFTMILHSEMKEDVLVEVDGKESEYKPYILVKMKNGNEMRFEAQKDTTLRAGYYVNQNYGADPTLRVLDSGYPIDSNTQRAYLGFDLRSIPNLDDVASAELYIHAENMEKTGNKRLAVLYYSGAPWDEATYTWADTKGSMALYSYSGTKGGFEFSYPPGCDAEVLLNQIGRLYHLHNISSGYAATKDERYAYAALNLLDGFYDHAGENNSYPRGFDGYERNNRFMSTYKLIADSKYMTPEMTTYFWKHMWELHTQVSITRDPFFNEVDNMMISFCSQTITFLSEFDEFHDTQKWLDIYVDRMLPLLRRVILDDGSYSEASDGYADGSIKTFASSVQMADKIGIDLGEQFTERIHKNIYFYSAMRLPDFGLPGYGDSNPYNGKKTEDSFLLSMADLYQDEVLRYIGANGTRGGTKPDFTSSYYPDSKRVYMRSDWTNDALYLMTNIDNGYSSHGHKDDLSIVAWAYGDFVITDTGRYNYTWSDPVNVELLSSQNHNTLGRITDLSTNKVYMQDYSGEKDKAQVNSWASSYDFDYFSGNTKEEVYVSDTPMKTGYNRKILFVKPNYWIVSDIVEDREAEGKTDNKYDIMFHLQPGSNYVIDNESKTVKTDFADTTNVQLLSPDADVEITREQAIYAPQTGSYTTTDRIVFSKTKPADQATTFDTVIYPTKAGDTGTSVSVERIDMDVPTSTASALQITRTDNSGTFTDYYYYTNENAFASTDTFAERTFGNFSYNGEMAFASYDGKGRLDSFEMVNGSVLAKDGTPVVEAEKQIPDLSISFDNSVMNVSSSVESPAELGNLMVQSGRSVDKVLFNGIPVTFSQYQGAVMVGSNTFIVDPTVSNPGSEDAYIALPAINYGDNFAYDGNTYSVTVQIPEGTKIRPIEDWDGGFTIDIESSNDGENIAGRIKIKTIDGKSIDFITPISISIPQHASASVSLVIDGRTVAQTTELSSADPSKANLRSNSAGLYKLRDNLWIITNECTELIVGKIRIPSLPGGSGENPGGGTQGGGTQGGGTQGGGTQGGGNPGGGTQGGGTQGGGTQDTQPPFNDLNDVLWAEAAINALYKKGIVNGKAEGVFAPHDQITRAEYTAILVRAFDLKADNAAVSFTDVAQGQWYTEPIAIAGNLGIVKGISETEFGVDDPITRQDMIVMLYRLTQSLGISFEPVRGTEGITDWDSVAEYAQEAVENMYCAEILNGVGDGRIAPEATAERAEAAKLIYEVLNKTGQV